MTKIIKTVITSILLCIIIILTWEYVVPSISNPFKIKTIKTTHFLILKEIKMIGNLELASYHFNDIVEQKLVRDFLPDPKALLIVHGEAVGCINLTKILLDDIQTLGDTLFITLPQPHVCHFKIDHSKSKIYDSEYAFLNEDLLYEEAFKSAEKKLLQSAIESGILKTTKENASKVLIPLFEKISDKPVQLRFSK
jgi:hypothetical protein